MVCSGLIPAGSLDTAQVEVDASHLVVALMPGPNHIIFHETIQ
jgi:hypothetical protein